MPFKLCHKKYFTLIEVIIALTLISILMTFLFGFYQNMTVVQNGLDKTREENFRRLYLQQRLTDILSTASVEENLFGNRELIFYTTKDENTSMLENSLILIYNNGVNALPWFSGTVLGRLYLDKNGRLCLTTWPSPALWKKEGKVLDKLPSKREILLEDVQNLSFEFYVPPIAEEVKVKPKEVTTGREKIEPAPGEWHKEWPDAYRELPALVKVVVETESMDKFIFVIPVANFGRPIIYLK